MLHHLQPIFHEVWLFYWTCVKLMREEARNFFGDICAYFGDIDGRWQRELVTVPNGTRDMRRVPRYYLLNKHKCFCLFALRSTFMSIFDYSKCISYAFIVVPSLMSWTQWDLAQCCSFFLCELLAKIILVTFNDVTWPHGCHIVNLHLESLGWSWMMSSIIEAAIKTSICQKMSQLIPPSLTYNGEVKKLVWP